MELKWLSSSDVIGHRSMSLALSISKPCEHDICLVSGGISNETHVSVSVCLQRCECFMAVAYISNLMVWHLIRLVIFRSESFGSGAIK